MIISSDLAKCREKFEELKGRRIICKTNGGRKRIITYVGVVENCYPNVFTVLCDNHKGKKVVVSFSYVDVLTRTVRVGVIAESEDQSVELAQAAG
ncbi:MAG: Veg family protein [Clostridiales bacterium]|nr:Veg family protein [Clostridiales bacterium]